MKAIIFLSTFITLRFIFYLSNVVFIFDVICNELDKRPTVMMITLNMLLSRNM